MRKTDLAAVLRLFGNDKTGLVATTTASIRITCPRDCRLREERLCYAQGGRVVIHIRRLDRSRATRLQAAQQEADQIDAVRKPRGLPLRLHVGGDAACDESASILGGASRRWVSRGGGPVWTYTHAWREVLRRSWGNVSVLASCEFTSEGRRALKRGYAPAVIVPELPANGRAFKRDGIKWVPCPEQTRGVQCRDCGLCFDAEGLRERKTGIAFAAHGQRRKRLLHVLTQAELAL